MLCKGKKSLKIPRGLSEFVNRLKDRQYNRQKKPNSNDLQNTTQKTNGVGSIYGRSSLKSAHFVMIHYQTWLPQAILVSNWPIIFKSSPLKPLGQMNRNLVGRWLISFQSVNKHGYHRNLVGIIYGISSMKIAHIVPIG